jgi:hypothetical protein
MDQQVRLGRTDTALLVVVFRFSLHLGSSAKGDRNSKANEGEWVRLIHRSSELCDSHSMEHQVRKDHGAIYVGRTAIE